MTQPVDVRQEAVDATSTAYTGDSSIDVAEHLRRELHSRGIDDQDQTWVDDVASRIRSGHTVVLGDPDGSIEARDEPDGRV